MKLVKVAELKDWLGILASDRTQDRNLSRVLSDVTAEFEKACGRAETPFRSAATASAVEIQNGEGVKRLRLDYPITALASVVVGLDVAAPEETLDV